MMDFSKPRKEECASQFCDKCNFPVSFWAHEYNCHIDSIRNYFEIHEILAMEIVRDCFEVCASIVSRKRDTLREGVHSVMMQEAGETQQLYEKIAERIDNFIKGV